MPISDPEERFHEIERRLERIEAELHLSKLEPDVTTSTSVTAAAEPLPPVVPPPPLPEDWMQSAILSKRVAQAAHAFPPSPVKVTPPPADTPAAADAPRPALAPLEYDARPRPPKSKAQQNAWEQLIGLKLAGWVGAIVLVIGAGFGIKYGYDQGWLKSVSPTIRLTLMYLGGFILLARGNSFTEKSTRLPRPEFLARASRRSFSSAMRATPITDSINSRQHLS